jgi:hypothetical protein
LFFPLNPSEVGGGHPFVKKLLRGRSPVVKMG